MKLLLVEDDPMTGSAIQHGLRMAGFLVDWVRDGKAAELALEAGCHTLLLLDLGLPSQDGLALLEWLRTNGNAMPVLIITARDAVSDRIEGLNLGADDYLIKPFDPNELVARVHALVRHHAGRAHREMRLGELTLDPLTREVHLSGQPIALSQREFTILACLLDTPGAVLSIQELEDSVYGWEEEASSNAIEVHLHKLRSKLGPDWIREVRGVGYKVAEPSG